MQINQLRAGDVVRLVDYGRTNALYRRRLLSLGLIKGVEIRVIRFAPLGCPLQIEVKGISLTLRREEAMDLEWEKA